MCSSDLNIYSAIRITSAVYPSRHSISYSLITDQLILQGPGGTMENIMYFADVTQDSSYTNGTLAFVKRDIKYGGPYYVDANTTVFEPTGLSAGTNATILGARWRCTSLPSGTWYSEPIIGVKGTSATTTYNPSIYINSAGSLALTAGENWNTLLNQTTFGNEGSEVLYFITDNTIYFYNATTTTNTYTAYETMRLTSSRVYIGSTAHTGVGLTVQGTCSLVGNVTITGNIIPAAGNTYSIGTSKTVDFKNIYSRNAVTTGSDERIKENIADIPDEVLDVWEEVKFREFNFKDLNNDRVHLGVIAQQVLKVFQDHNLDPAKYTFFCYDKWDDEYEDTINEDGVKEHKLINPAGDLYSIRYTDLLIIEAAYQRRKSKQLEEKNKELEDRIKRLEEVLGL